MRTSSFDARALTQAERDVLEHVEVREERIVLEHRGHRPAVRRHAAHVAAVHLDSALGRLVEPRDHLQRGRLAAAARADQREELALARSRGRPAHRGDVAEAALERRRAARRARSRGSLTSSPPPASRRAPAAPRTLGHAPPRAPRERGRGHHHEHADRVDLRRHVQPDQCRAGARAASAASGPPRNSDVTTLSSENENTSRPATITAGRISGSVTRRKARHGVAPRSAAACLERRRQRREARLDDDRRVGRVEHDVADHDRRDAELDVVAAQQKEEADRHDRLRQDDPHVGRGVEQLSPARARCARAPRERPRSRERERDDGREQRDLEAVRRRRARRSLSSACSNQRVVKPSQPSSDSSAFTELMTTRTIGAYRAARGHRARRARDPMAAARYAISS